MKIFPTQESSKVTDTKVSGEGPSVKKGPKGKKHAPAAEKQQVSESEIREKLAAHVETSNTAKSAVLKKNSQKLGDGFMNPDAKPLSVARPEPRPQSQLEAAIDEGEKADKEDKHLLKSDINLNDPKDPATQEKLKTVLSSGGFSFNARERETLDKILNGN